MMLGRKDGEAAAKKIMRDRDGLTTVSCDPFTDKDCYSKVSQESDLMQTLKEGVKHLYDHKKEDVKRSSLVPDGIREVKGRIQPESSVKEMLL